MAGLQQIRPAGTTSSYYPLKSAALSSPREMLALLDAHRNAHTHLLQKI